MGLAVFRVADDIWCLRRRSYLTCSYVVRTTQGKYVAIDAGMDSEAQDVTAALKVAFDVGLDALDAVLITHWHNDHAAGACSIKERTNASILYHKGDEPELTRRTASLGLRGWIAQHIPERGPLVLLKGLLGEATPRAVTADRLVVDGETVLDDFEVLETPGHTAGHLSFYYRPARALFAGDALAVIDGRLRLMARPVTPDLERARQSLSKCLARDVALLCPGHRAPLATDVQARCDEMRVWLSRNSQWPLLG